MRCDMVKTYKSPEIEIFIMSLSRVVAESMIEKDFGELV